MVKMQIGYWYGELMHANLQGGPKKGRKFMAP